VSLLVRRTRQACRRGGSAGLLHVGTSATLAQSTSWPEAQREVAGVAAQIFGAPVRPERVIGESLRRATDHVDDFRAPALRDALRRRLAGSAPIPGRAEEMRRDPVAQWIESHLGLDEDDSGRLVRGTPEALGGQAGAARRLRDVVPEVSEQRAVEALRQTLLAGARLRGERGRPVFAFRLHQFLPLAFCRECGRRLDGDPEPLSRAVRTPRQDRRKRSAGGQRLRPGAAVYSPQKVIPRTEPIMESTQRHQVVEEIDRVPLEYLPGLLRMVRAFRESVTLKTAEASFRQGWQEALDGDTRPVSELWDDLDAG